MHCDLFDKRRWPSLPARVAAVLAALATTTAFGETSLKPASMFTDHMVLQRDAKIPVWGEAPAGANVVVEFAGQSKSTVADAAGAWRVDLDPLGASSESRDLAIKADDAQATLHDIVVGEVWVASGQSNMEWPLKLADDAEQEIADAKWPLIRAIDVPNVLADDPLESFKGSWKSVSPENAGEVSAVAYFFARQLHKELGVPVGIVGSNWGGSPMEAWTDGDVLAATPPFDDDEAIARKLASEKNADGTPKFPQFHIPGVLFDGMIEPIIPYAIRGAIWYQGETNAGRNAEYLALSKLMIGNWRQAWGQGDFPFLLVQLAAFEPGGDSWPPLREAQRKTVHEVPNTGMAVAIDIGHRTDIHPRNKQEVGRRLALVALAKTYGKDVEFSGPEFKSLTSEAGKARLAFDHVDGGLRAHGEGLRGFEVAGADGKFYAAEAAIDGESVVVSAKEVAEPTAVRYDWAAFPDGNLFNASDLPAVPFSSN
jgi:sialate O-acetylesterase